MKLIGLTGGIACGKSTVARLLRDEHGFVLVDCDEIVRELQKPGTAVTRRIAREFADDHVVDERTGELDRQRLGDAVFRDAAKRRRLNALMRVPTLTAILKALIRAWLTHPRDQVVILDAPLLYETGFFTHFCSRVIVVGCSEDTQLRRLQSRNSLDAVAGRARVQSQMSVDEKLKRADYPIHNETDDLQALRRSVGECATWATRQRTTFNGWNRIVALASAVVVALLFAAHNICRRLVVG
jgi:dephospho-CoA kinase